MNAFLLDDGRLRVGWRFVFSVMTVIAVNYVAAIFAAMFAGNRPLVEDAIYRPLLMVLLLGSFYAMVKLFDQPAESFWNYIGFPRKGWLRQAAAGALLGFALIFLAIIFIAIFFNYHTVRIVVNPRTLELPLLIGFILLTAAMAEELTFRGYPFQRLVQGIGKVGAIIVVSALFGAVHLHNPHVSDSRAVQIFAFCNTLLIGIVFAIAYLRTGALWFPWGLHFSWNFTMGLIFGLPVSGLTDFSVVVHARTHGPAWLLGGGYGLEGGFLGTLIMLLGLTYVVFFVRPLATLPPPPYIDEVNGGIQRSGDSAAARYGPAQTDL